MTADGQRPPTTGSAGHYDPETLALLDAEAFEPHVAARVRGHTSGCAVCGSTLAALRTVRTELAGLTTPRLPASVAARMDATIEAERRARFGPTPLHPRAGVGAPVRPRRSGRVRMLGWAAAAVVLLGGAGIGTVALHGPATGKSQLATAASPPDSRPGTTGKAGPAHQPGQPGIAPVAPNGVTSNAGEVPSYTRNDIGTSLAQILAQSACGVATPCGTQSAGAMSDSSRRARCTSELDSVAGVRGKPKAVQYALFEGRQAFVFIFGTDRIVVVGTDCGQSASPEVLFNGP